MKKLMTLFLALALAASLTVPALAGFTPSVENKGGPTVVDAVFEDGTDAGPYLRVTAYGKRNTSDNAAVAIKKILEDAHTEVKSTGRLDSLTADVNTWLTDHHAGVKAEDLLVSDLFDVSFVQGGELLEGMPASHKTVTITFQLTVPVENVLLVLHKDGSSWELKNSKNTAQYEKIGKDQVKVTFDSLSPVVFAIDSAEFHVDPNGPTSPPDRRDFSRRGDCGHDHRGRLRRRLCGAQGEGRPLTRRCAGGQACENAELEKSAHWAYCGGGGHSGCHRGGASAAPRMGDAASGE